MAIEDEIKRAIDNALGELNIVAILDGDNDLEITLFRGSDEVTKTYVQLDSVFLKIEPLDH